MLTFDDVSKLWIPSLIFERTNRYTRTVQDDLLVVTVSGAYPSADYDLTEIRESIKYKGFRNQIHSSRLYHHKFACQFSLDLYPFDHQTCFIWLKLNQQQKHFVKLLPEKSWEINLKENIRTVGKLD